MFEEIKQIDIMSQEHKKVCLTLNCMELLLILISTFTGYIPNVAFWAGIFIGSGGSSVWLKMLAITAEIKKGKPIIKKKKKKQSKIILLAKTKLNIIAVLISRALIDSCISYNEFFSVNNVIRNNHDKKEAIKNPKIIDSDHLKPWFCW